jgi:hypothetical protein
MAKRIAEILRRKADHVLRHDAIASLASAANDRRELPGIETDVDQHLGAEMQLPVAVLAEPRPKSLATVEHAMHADHIDDGAIGWEASHHLVAKELAAARK